MSYLRLRDSRSNESHEFERTEVRIGRAPEMDLVVLGEGRKVVSSLHTTLTYRDGVWWIADARSRNGTYVEDRRLAPGRAEIITSGSTIRLGVSGPAFTVEATGPQRVSQTLAEDLMPYEPSAPTVPMDEYGASPMVRAETGPEFRVVLREASGTRHDGAGPRVRIGRGRECEIRPVARTDTTLSRVHAELELLPSGTVVLRDAGSRNGTVVNRRELVGDHTLRVGDRIQLGWTGPELVVEELELLRARDEPSEAAPVVPVARAAERSFGGKGATVFFRHLVEESTRKSHARVRWLVWSFVMVSAVAVGVVYWVSELRFRDTLARLDEQRTIADSTRQSAAAEYERLRSELESARESAAPAAVLDSLRTALSEARDRTDALEEALRRAQSSLDRQRSVGDSLQRRATEDLARLRSDLERAGGASGSTRVLDSLRQALRAAEERAANIEANVRALKLLDLASVSQANQSAVGLVTAFSGAGVFDGTGFALTPSGYFVTNRHVVIHGEVRPDSVFVTMADERRPYRADLVSAGDSFGTDLAVVSIRDFNGAYVRHVDWTGSKMRQGEAAVLIGFPAGLVVALDASRTVRTSMNGGYFSKVTPELVQFDGFTISGSSGSPIFNANGEVVAVHRAGLKEAVGLGFGVPITHLIPLLPQQARAELNLP